MDATLGRWDGIRMRRTASVISGLGAWALGVGFWSCSGSPPHAGVLCEVRNQPVLTASASAPTALQSQPSATPAASIPAPGAADLTWDEARALQRSEPGRIQCGRQVCSMDEHCCIVSGDEKLRAICEANGGDPKMFCSTGFDDLQWTREGGEMLGCDEDLDCPQDSMCCLTNVGGQWSKSECLRMRLPGVNVCEELEPCAPGGRCATRGTVCQRGRCEPPLPPIRCGTQTCGGKTPLCCVHAETNVPRCTTEEDCNLKRNLGRAVRCTSPSHCPSGQSCCTGMEESYCAGGCIGNGAKLCNRDSACVGNLGPRCTLMPVPLVSGTPLKLCAP